MKKRYEGPEIELIYLPVTDILTESTSTYDPDPGTEVPWEDPTNP